MPHNEKKDIKPWQQREWRVPEVSTDYMAAMQEVLDLYQAAYDTQRPIICFDEAPAQLIAEVLEPQAIRLWFFFACPHYNRAFRGRDVSPLRRFK
jgi:hypothetical protein